ncbi:hypothetical protein CR513_56477, partial [Mucuna pruriens]
MGCILGQHEEFNKKEHIIYYLISKMDPIMYIFEKLALIERITHWQVSLLKCDIILHAYLNADSLSARCRVALGRDWSNMVSVEPYPTRSRLSADRRNRVRLTLFRTKMQEIGDLVAD